MHRHLENRGIWTQGSLSAQFRFQNCFVENLNTPNWQVRFLKTSICLSAAAQSTPNCGFWMEPKFNGEIRPKFSSLGYTEGMKYIAPSFLGLYYNPILLLTLLINNTCPLHNFPAWHGDSICLFSIHKEYYPDVSCHGNYQSPRFEQKHNLGKEQKKKNEITVNMPKALDNRSLILLSKRKSFTLALLYFTGNLQWHVNGKNCLLTTLTAWHGL